MDSSLEPQTIPNPNQDRLGFPPPQTSKPSNKGQREAQSQRAHAEALQVAEELLSQARQLREKLRDKDIAHSGSVKQQTEKIGKLARKLRSRLQSG